MVLYRWAESPLMVHSGPCPFLLGPAAPNDLCSKTAIWQANSPLYSAYNPKGPHRPSQSLPFLLDLRPSEKRNGASSLQPSPGRHPRPAQPMCPCNLLLSSLMPALVLQW